ncbi:MAG: helix-turn-helix transcriptional regulator [Myxococcota bacterium]
MSHDPDVRALHLKAMREEAGLSQAALAKEIGVSRSLVGLVETGRSGMSVENLLAWVEVCNGDLEQVIPYRGTGMASRIRRLPEDRQALLRELVELLGWIEQRFVRILTLFIRSLRDERKSEFRDEDSLRHRSAEESQD